MTVLEKYIKELEADVVVDELNLKEAALMLPAKKAKWVSRLMLEKNNFNDLQRKKTKIVREAVEELKRESGVRLATPTLERAAEKHPAVVAIESEIQNTQSVVDFLERVEKVMHSLGFDIKNLIELIKMETA